MTDGKEDVSIDRFVARWAAVARSAKPVKDFDEVGEVLGRAYRGWRWREIPRSRVVLAPSPFVAMVGAALAGVYWDLDGSRVCRRRADGELLKYVRRRFDRKDKSLNSQTVKCTPLESYQTAIYTTVEQVCMKLNPMVMHPLNRALDVLTRVVLVGGGMVDAVGKVVRNPEMRDSVVEVVRACTGVDDFRIEVDFADAGKLGDVVGAFDSSNLTSALPAFTSYLRSVGIDMGDGKLAKEIRLREEISVLCGPWVAHPEFCVVSDRPSLLTVDGDGLLHAPETGPACRWRDGTRLYYLHGVQVGSRHVDDPGSLTAEVLESMSEAQRRVCLPRVPEVEQVVSVVRALSDADPVR